MPSSRLPRTKNPRPPALNRRAMAKAAKRVRPFREDALPPFAGVAPSGITRFFATREGAIFCGALHPREGMMGNAYSFKLSRVDPRTFEPKNEVLGALIKLVPVKKNVDIEYVFQPNRTYRRAPPVSDRGRQLFRALLEVVIPFARQNRCARLTLMATSPALAEYYKQFGFRIHHFEGEGLGKSGSPEKGARGKSARGKGPRRKEYVGWTGGLIAMYLRLP